MENELEIVCQDCGVTFVHSSRPDARRPADPPTRCSLCRAQARSSSSTEKPNYTGEPNEYRSPMACSFPEPQRPRRDGPRRLRSGPGNEQARRQDPRRFAFTGVCAKCGATAHLPFQPSKFQEVLCRACFQEKRGIRPAPDPASET